MSHKIEDRIIYGLEREKRSSPEKLTENLNAPRHNPDDHNLNVYRYETMRCHLQL
jgi:hypothetical protein